ncbi:MAG: hypothetical protein EZS28_053438, partial [Streblomastix strix]
MARTFDVLSKHTAIATYGGIEHIPCRHMTSLCPDKCNHARDVGKFNIEKYEFYEKKGEYGDEQQKVYHFNTNPNAEQDKQDPALIQKVKDLPAGAKVRITWEHIY